MRFPRPFQLHKRPARALRVLAKAKGTRLSLSERPVVFRLIALPKKPERIMALLMVMTVCLLVYAALEYRLRTALKDHDATFPDHKGKPKNKRGAAESRLM
jgi:hypothetical protein